jgi:hypothetical protein
MSASAIIACAAIARRCAPPSFSPHWPGPKRSTSPSSFGTTK